MTDQEVTESPRKRLKTDNASSTDEVAVSLADNGSTTTPAVQAPSSNIQSLKEIEVGITEFVSVENQGFSGVLKKRYTDFLVNEILPSGEVLHLRNIATPAVAEQKAKSNVVAVTVQPVSNPSIETDGTNEGVVGAQPTANASATGPKSQAKAEEQTASTGLRISDEDMALLESFFGDEKTKELQLLHDRGQAKPKARPSELGKVTVSGITDKDVRTKIHQAIRRVFNSQLESSADQEGAMVITVAANRHERNARRGKGGSAQDKGGRINWGELGGPFLHFTLYKENKDTMESINFIARQLKTNTKGFHFAGTKDRRGVTVQRVSATRIHADRLARMNSTLRNAVLGDFEYCKQNIELGDLLGNEFVITLRDCEFPGVDMRNPEDALARAKEIVGTSLRNLHERGYFNYYGLQRFGTFSTRTDMVGLKMLQGDFQGACDAILHFSRQALAAAQGTDTGPDDGSGTVISTDDKARAEAIHIFKTSGRINESLDKLPRKFFGEANIIRHLGRAKNDYIGALQSIPRSLRLMYVHAYQSFVWNSAAGERWRLYGDKVVEGDLVIISEHADKETGGATGPADSEVHVVTAVDADGEVIVAPAAEDSAYATEDMFTRARALTAAEAASGKYTIFDVVLPLPGFDVLYPANAMTDFYKSFMASERGGGLDPFDMRRKWKDVSLSGGYRKLLSRMGKDYSFDVKLYSHEDRQFVQTDLDRLKGVSRGGDDDDDDDESAPSTDGDKKIAVILKFQLGSSQYATMALRELTKGQVKAYSPEFGGR